MRVTSRVWGGIMKYVRAGGPVQPYPRPNLRNIVNYCIISHNIAQYREISRTRQPRPRPKGHVRAKRPLINTPYKNSRPQTLVTLDHRRSIGRASRRGRAARTMNLGGGKRGRRAENRAKSPDIARYRQILRNIAYYREISRRRYCERLWRG